MDINKFMNWTGGFTNATAALDFAMSGGIPTTGLQEGGEYRAARLEHVWVEAWVDMTPSFGAIMGSGGKTWTPLDGSYKQYAYTEGMDIAEAVPFDAEALVNDIVGSATINEAEGWVTGVDSALIENAMTDYKAQVEDYFASQQPDATVGDVLGTKTIVAMNHQIFMGTLPYKLRTMGTRHSTIPDGQRHKIKFEVTHDFTDPIKVTYAMPAIAGKKITLSYSPATQADEDVINSYLPTPHADGTPIDPSEFPSELPAYLINLKPQLMIDGNIVATGGAVTMGTAEKMRMTFIDPAHGSDIINNIIDAGEYWGIAVDVARISKKMIEDVKARLEATKAKLEAEDYTGITKDNLLGDLLYITAMTYYAEYDVMDHIQARTMGLNDIRFPSEAIFKTSLSVDESFGVPVSVGINSLTMDVDRILRTIKAKDGDNAKKLQFMQSSGINSSTLEHSVPEQILSTPENPVEGVSAVKALQIAASQGIPIYTVTKDNIDTVLSQLLVDPLVKAAIRDAVNAGNDVTVSKSNINFNGWIGCGYIVTNPTTGEGSYMISSLESGGDHPVPLAIASFFLAFCFIFLSIVTLASTAILAVPLILGALGGLALGLGFSQIMSDNDKYFLNMAAADAIWDLLPFFLIYGYIGLIIWMVILSILQLGLLNDVRDDLSN